MYNLRKSPSRNEKTPASPAKASYRSRSQGRSPSRSGRSPARSPARSVRSPARKGQSPRSSRTRAKSKDRRFLDEKAEVNEFRGSPKKADLKPNVLVEKMSRSSTPKPGFESEGVRAPSSLRDTPPFFTGRVHSDVFGRPKVEDGSESEISMKSTSSHTLRIRTIGSYISTDDVPLKELTPPGVGLRLSELIEREATPKSQGFSEPVEIDEETCKKVEEWKKRNVPTEFGGCFGSFALMVLIPVGMLLLHVLPIKSFDALLQLPDFKLKDFFDLQVFGFYMAYVISLTQLSMLPIGKKVEGLPDKIGRYYYRCNGLFTCFLAGAILGTIHYFFHPITFIYEKYNQFLVASMVFGFVLTIILFVHGSRASPVALNPCGITYNVVYDMWMGRVLNPRFGNLDVKMTLMKVSLITNVILYAILILQKLGMEAEEEEWDISLYFTLSLQLFYALQCLWFEETKISSFYVLYEGVGFLTVMGSCLYPFFTTMLSKYLLEHRQEYNIFGILYSIVLSCVGYYIYWTSNLQKHKYRMHPVSLILDIPAISTTRGRKIMTAGWWGYVRHPNYLGDIILHWAWVGCCGFGHWLPYTVPLFTTVLLLHRAKRDEGRCKLRYREAYDKYCELVKARVVPKLF